ncbi:MAG TPA: hypothetical protein VIX83_02810 [Candidatus Cybelea sp.]
MHTARNGDVELAYDIEGEGPDLPLIAGAPATRALWLLVRAELGAAAAAVLDAAGSQHAHALGHSLGGVVAQEFALRTRGYLRSI